MSKLTMDKSIWIISFIFSILMKFKIQLSGNTIQFKTVPSIYNHIDNELFGNSVLLTIKANKDYLNNSPGVSH